MASFFCVHCDKFIPDRQAIPFGGFFYCPLCRLSLRYFGEEELEFSQEEGQPMKVDPKEAAKEFTGKFKHYEAPSINTQILECEDMLMKNPKNIEALLHLAQIYKANKDIDFFKEFIYRIITIEPNHFESYRLLADFCLDEKNIDGALRFLDILNRLEPNHLLVIYNLGIAWYMNQNIPKAIEFFLKAKHLSEGKKQQESINDLLKIMVKEMRAKGLPTDKYNFLLSL